MDYRQVTFFTTDEALKEILIATLSEDGYEGFEEMEDGLRAFIAKDQFDEALTDTIAKTHTLRYELEDIQQQNWNAQWEASFEPVIVEGFCTVRADFHKVNTQTPYEVIITPKMSFGTGHHATTQLMMQKMSKMQMVGKRVLDFGTGTGILAILAEKLGAANVLAIDNDEWSYENALENISRNDVWAIDVVQGSLEVADGQAFDIILANINRHILLQYMEQLAIGTKKDGRILMSGLLKEDKNIIVSSASDAGFVLLEEKELNNWIALLFEKQ